MLFGCTKETSSSDIILNDFDIITQLNLCRIAFVLPSRALAGGQRTKATDWIWFTRVTGVSQHFRINLSENVLIVFYQRTLLNIVVVVVVVYVRAPHHFQTYVSIQYK